jgi:hypothetical protein
MNEQDRMIAFFILGELYCTVAVRSRGANLIHTNNEDKKLRIIEIERVMRKRWMKNGVSVSGRVWIEKRLKQRERGERGKRYWKILKRYLFFNKFNFPRIDKTRE